MLFSIAIICFLLCGANGEDHDKPEQYELLDSPTYYHALETMIGSAREHLCDQAYDTKDHLVLRFCQQNYEFKDHPIQEMKITNNQKRGGYRPADESCSSCITKYRPQDLGRRYYPRYVPAAHCELSSCRIPTQTCQPKEYLIKVLRRRSPSKQETLDTFLPEALRYDWIFEEVSVNVACECSS